MLGLPSADVTNKGRAGWRMEDGSQWQCAIPGFDVGQDPYQRPEQSCARPNLGRLVSWLVVGASTNVQVGSCCGQSAGWPAPQACQVWAVAERLQGHDTESHMTRSSNPPAVRHPALVRHDAVGHCPCLSCVIACPSGWGEVF